MANDEFREDTQSMLGHAAELHGLRRSLNTLLFDTHCKRGKLTNMIMLLIIIVAVALSMLGTVDTIHARWGDQIARIEQAILIIFAIEYLFRIYAARNRGEYMRSFNGVVDLLTVLPLFIVGDAYVMVRLLRLARVIRVAISFPVVRALFLSLQGSVNLLLGVLGTIALISILIGNTIYILEPQTFSNAFEGTWWSLVTMSTVGYGDFVPETAAGKALAASLIMSGICMFSMVTAVISVKVGRMVNHMKRCLACNRGLASEYAYCPHCAAAQPDHFEPRQPTGVDSDDT